MPPVNEFAPVVELLTSVSVPSPVFSSVRDPPDSVICASTTSVAPALATSIAPLVARLMTSAPVPPDPPVLAREKVSVLLVALGPIEISGVVLLPPSPFKVSVLLFAVAVALVIVLGLLESHVRYLID